MNLPTDLHVVHTSGIRARLCLHTIIHKLNRTSNSHYLHVSSLLFEPLRPVAADGSPTDFQVSMSRAIDLSPFHDLPIIN